MSIPEARPVDDPEFLPPLQHSSIEQTMSMIDLVFGHTLTEKTQRIRRRSAEARRLAWIKFQTLCNGEVTHETVVRAKSSIYKILHSFEQNRKPDEELLWCLGANFYCSGMKDHQRDYRIPLDTNAIRHLTAIVLDIDISLASPAMVCLQRENPQGFLRLLAGDLEKLGIDSMAILKTNPIYGFQVIIPVIGLDGKYLGANETTLEIRRQVTMGLQTGFNEYGVDPVIHNPIQPHIVCGIHRAKHPDFIPYVVMQKQGTRTDLVKLRDRLREVHRIPTFRAIESLIEVNVSGDALAIDIQDFGKGAAFGSRSKLISRASAFLIIKGASTDLARNAVLALANRCDPPLPQSEALKIFGQVVRQVRRGGPKWQRMAKVPWNDFRQTVGLPTVKWGRRPITPARSYLDRQLNGGRIHIWELKDHIQQRIGYEGQGGAWEGSQKQMAAEIGAAYRSFQFALNELASEGVIAVESRRGQGGYTRLTLCRTQEVGEPTLTTSKVTDGPPEAVQGHTDMIQPEPISAVDSDTHSRFALGKDVEAGGSPCLNSAVQAASPAGQGGDAPCLRRLRRPRRVSRRRFRQGGLVVSITRCRDGPG